MLIGVFIGACGKENVVNAYSGKFMEKIGYCRDIEIWRDSETGVNYFIFNSSNKAGMCPRYNLDGTLYTD